MAPVLGLSFHRAYACRHSGACCSAGWTIPVETPILVRLQAAHATGRLPVSSDGDALLELPEPRDDYGGLIGTHADGRCVFRTGGDEARPDHGRCDIHGRLGHDALPHACQQFPRVAVVRPDSVAVSLSHFCPSAAALLLDAGPVRIEEVGDAGSGRGPLEGLDMRAALPPLLAPGILFTWTGFDRWERFVVEILCDDARTLAEAVGTIVAAADALERWSIADGPFDPFVDALLARWSTDASAPPFQLSAEASAAAHALVRSTVPLDLRLQQRPSTGAPGDHASWLDAHEAVVRRYLAARTWASWPAHEGAGIRGYVRWLLAAWGVLRVQAGRERDLMATIRQSDLLLVHHASPRQLARRLGEP